MLIRAGLEKLNKNDCCTQKNVFFMLGESKDDVLLHYNVFCVIFISDSQITLLDTCFLYCKGQRKKTNLLYRQCPHNCCVDKSVTVLVTLPGKINVFMREILLLDSIPDEFPYVLF